MHMRVDCNTLAKECNRLERWHEIHVRVEYNTHEG